MSVSDLFKPLTLLHGPAMRNRFMMAPLTSQQSEYDGTASEFDQFWYEQLAKSGYGLIQTSAATVEAGAIAFERQFGIHCDDHLPGLTKIATAIREGGALSAVQLDHGGHRAKPEIGGIPAPASDKTVPGVKAITTEEVERIRDSFIAAAVRAKLAGFNGVSVHGASFNILSTHGIPKWGDKPTIVSGVCQEACDFLSEAYRKANNL